MLSPRLESNYSKSSYDDTVSIFRLKINFFVKKSFFERFWVKMLFDLDDDTWRKFMKKKCNVCPNGILRFLLRF